MSDDEDPCRIVLDGRERAVAEHAPRITAEVETEFAERLRGATFWQRIRLNREMRAEIERRLEQVAPSDGLY
ncbi:MAG: hypothetical protein KF847_16275 [Pirellulales bacterium]|nr:hypothetical protein [Pirellulales bacterium]